MKYRVLTTEMWSALLSVIAAVSCICLWFLRKQKGKRKGVSHGCDQSGVVIKDLAKPKLPLPIRAFNLLGKVFPPKQLTVEGVMMEAQRRTGLKHYLDEDIYPFRDGLQKLVQDYNDNKNRLTKFGRLCLRNVFVRNVAINLSIAERIQKNPQILREQIESPVFIIGPPRTGSSHLHDTLAQHPIFRTPKHLELFNPVLDEDQYVASEPDPRQAKCDAYLKFASYLRPFLSLLHDVGANTSEEDIFATGIVFRSVIFGFMFPCKEYMQWFGEVDHRPAYEFLKLVLQVTSDLGAISGLTCSMP